MLSCSTWKMASAWMGDDDGAVATGCDVQRITEHAFARLPNS